MQADATVRSRPSDQQAARIETLEAVSGSDTHEDAASIRLDGQNLTITRLVVSDQCVAEQVALAGEQQAERARRVRLLLEGGARVATLGSGDIMLRRIHEALASGTRGLAHERDAIDGLLRAAKQEFESSLQQLFREQVGVEGQQGALAHALHASSERFLAEVSEQLTNFKGEFDDGRTDNLLARLSTTFSTSWQQAMGELQKSFTSDGPDNPLRHALKGHEEVLAGILRQMRALEETVTQRLVDIAEKVTRETTRAEERRVSSAKGRDFEKLVFDELWTLAAPYGDIVVDVTDVTAANGKTGDYVVSMAADGHSQSEVKVVWEAKNLGNPMSFNAAVKTLSAAMENRGARVGVLAFAHPEQMPGRDGPFMLLADKMLACCYDPEAADDSVLKVAYRLSRLLAFSSASIASTDSAALGEAIGHLNSALTALGTPRAQLREIRRRADEALAALGQADAALTEASQRLNRILTSG